MQLSVSWRVITAEHVATKLNIPENLNRNVSGQVVFEGKEPKEVPDDAFKDETIKMVSAQLQGVLDYCIHGLASFSP